MIQMADEVFASRTDPNQLNVNEEVISHLQQIHPATVSEYNDGNGPAAWVLGFPTTIDLMNRFIENKISEKELYELTPIKGPYEALYLCSAMVLPEYRRKGIAEKLTLKAIASIQKDQPIKALFVWAFSKEGDALAEKVAALSRMPLKKKQGHPH